MVQATIELRTEQVCELWKEEERKEKERKEAKRKQKDDPVVPEDFDLAFMPSLRANDAADLESRVAKYLEKCKPAIQGDNGSADLMATLRKVREKFELNESDLLRFAAKYYNPICVPPWSEDELRRAVGNIFGTPGEPPSRQQAETHKENPPPNEEEKPEAKEEKHATLETVCLADVKPQPIRWAVPDYIPLGKLSLVAGDSGLGKSLMTLSLVSSISRGLCAFGLTYDDPIECDVLLCSCEDDLADTVVPRLAAMGANMKRIHSVKGVRGADGKPKRFSLVHLQEIERKLRTSPAIKLLVIDPVSAFLGGKIDDHKDAEVRQLLGPLAELVAHYGVAAPLVKHVNRNTTAKATNRIMGSSGWVNTVRLGMMLVRDEEDDTLRLLLPIKSNITANTSGLVFRVEPLGDFAASEIVRRYDHLTQKDKGQLASQLFRVQWMGKTDKNVDDVLQASHKSKEKDDPPKLKEAMQWLTEALGIAQRRVCDVRKESDLAGIATNTLYRAKDRLGVLQSGEKGNLMWEMPPKESA